MRILTTGLALVFAASCGGSSKPGPKRVKQPAELVSKTKVFKGAEGIRVSVLEMNDGKRALVQVTGSESQFENKTVECVITDDGPYRRYTTKVRGRDWNVVVREKSRRNNSNVTWRSYLGAGYSSGVKLAMDEEASASLDVVPIYRQYEDQKFDGTLDKLSKFNRSFEEGEEMKAFAEEAASMKDKCGVDVELSVDWKSVDDETLMSKSIASFCSNALDAMASLCRSSVAQAYAKNNMKKMHCRIGDGTALELSGGKATLTWNDDSRNLQQFSRDKLLAAPFQDNTLQYHIKLDETAVCVNDDASKYVVWAPEGAQEPGVLYGDGKTFTRARHSEKMLDGWFLEPRFYNKQYSNNFRGLNMRSHSKVDVKKKSGSCELACGTQKATFKLLTGKQARDIAANLTVAEDVHPYEPYALARDRRGTYYYVDRSTKPGLEKAFRLYVGKKGNLKLQKMRDIVSDSQGEIFASKTGELRLILDKEEAAWIRRKRKSALTLVPIRDNLQMIYNELGVYDGQSLGTPCDDIELQ